MSNKKIVLYVDDNIQELHKKIGGLEENILNLTQDKLSIENTIHSFNNQYNESVGYILIKYLEKREENIQKKIDDTKDDEKKEELEEKLNIAKEDIQDFDTYYNKKKIRINTLTPQEEIQLKILYKKACKLCHPDMVNENFKEEAISIFHRLNEANQQKNIFKVREILQYLENSDMSLSDKESDKEVLQKRHFALKSDVLKLELEIADLKRNNTYKKIQNIQDWDRYFKIISKQLEKEIHKQEV